MLPQGRRILVLSNFFNQGHGGTPESVLLLAQELAASAIAVDVLCNKGLVRDAQNLRMLPAADAAFSNDAALLDAYSALFIAGSWHKRAPWLALRAARKGMPITYAAKGCLCEAEFQKLRDMRRIPYFLAVEWLPMVLARRIVLSSQAERRASVVPAIFWKRRAKCLEEPFRGGAMGAAAAPSSVPTLGFLAEISPRKGLFELIEGLGHYLASHKNAVVRLRVAGETRRGSAAYLDACLKLAEQNGAAAHIEWCGAIRGERRSDFYRSLDFFVCPSRFESFGLTPLEALWQGIPVCLGPNLGVLEYMQADAPLLRLSSLGKEEIANAIAAVVENGMDWRDRGRAWEGRQALTRSNSDIAKDFARVLLSTEPA